MAKRRGKAKTNRSPIVAKQVTDHQPASGEVAVHQMPGVLVSMKVCRLCETKDGPFLNIFGGEKNTAKKIDEVMPFNVAENDELPHKICFRCSAKVEELHEFIQKCNKTQHNFYNSLGKKIPLTSKTKTHRSMWEETLNKSNITNDDICDAVIKKAMEGIKDIAVQLEKPKTEAGKERISFNTKQPVIVVPKLINNSEKEGEVEPKKRKNIQTKDDDCGSKTLNIDDSKLNLGKVEKPLTRLLRSRNNDTSTLSEFPEDQTRTKTNKNNITNESSQNTDTSPEIKKVEKKEDPVSKPFNIMDHVIMIKVNGVGVLFQCKLCNRNFLKQEVVLSHWCAKNGAVKEDFTKKITLPEVPKAPTVKYINTKTDNSINSKSQGNTHSHIKTPRKEERKEEVKPAISIIKPKPKIGPASKVKKISNESVPTVGMKISPREPTPPLVPEQKTDPSFVQCAVAPSLNCRYKLVPGPNNTFSLVEILQNDTGNQKAKSATKRKSTNEKVLDCPESAPKVKRYQGPGRAIKQNNPEIIDLDESSSVINESAKQPYPVGLFQSVKPHPPARDPSTSGLVPFATSAQKKQSYTIVQTGNPSKLLISAKPQHVQEFQRKRSKKVKPLERESINEQPFSVTLEEATVSNDAELFNFMHLDPLLQPSYVLPTDNNIIVPEAQTSTSQQINANTSKSKSVYTCNMCGSKFTREQKLLAHIHAHYDKMDEEDMMRQEKVSKKRGKKT